MLTCHGLPSGQLLDNDQHNSTAYNGNAVTLSTESETNAYTPGEEFYGGQIFYPNNSAWNGDVEWVWLDACDTLNATGGGETAWTSTVGTGTRPIHAIFGAMKPVAGDLSSQINSFWSQYANYPGNIINNYELAMTTAQPQPWAVIANNNDLIDGVKQVGPDGPGSTTYVYQDVTILIAGKAGGIGDTLIKGTFDSGNGILRTDFPDESNLQIQPTNTAYRSTDLTITKYLDFEKKAINFADGIQEFIGNGLVRTIDKKSSLTKEQAGELASAYLKNNFPEFSSRLRLKEVSERVVNLYGSNQLSASWNNGYLVHYSILSGSIPVWNNFASVIIRGNDVDNVNFRYDDLKLQSNAIQNSPPITPLSAQVSLTNALPEIKSHLNITGKYEVLRAELMYVNRSVAEGSKTHSNDDIIPAWEFILNSSYKGEGSRREKVFRVWIDAIRGNFIGKIKY